MNQPRADTATALFGIDHIALRVGDPEAIAGFLARHCGMDSSESADDFTVVAPPGGRTKLFLSAADEAADKGALERVVLRVSDMERALALLPAEVRVERSQPELASFEGPEDLGLGFTQVFGGEAEYDVDHVVLRVMDPDETTLALAELGFVPRGGALHVADKQIRLEPGMRSAGENERLSHIGVVVESVEAVKGQALRGGLEVDELTLEPNRVGVYLRGPERLRIEYSERA